MFNEFGNMKAPVYCDLLNNKKERKYLEKLNPFFLPCKS